MVTFARDLAQRRGTQAVIKVINYVVIGVIIEGIAYYLFYHQP